MYLVEDHVKKPQSASTLLFDFVQGGELVELSKERLIFCHLRDDFPPPFPTRKINEMKDFFMFPYLYDSLHDKIRLTSPRVKGFVLKPSSPLLSHKTPCWRRGNWSLNI
jgi:hypothetical protein